MASSGTRVFVLGGESYAVSKPDEPALIHVLDTSAFFFFFSFLSFTWMTFCRENIRLFSVDSMRVYSSLIQCESIRHWFNAIAAQRRSEMKVAVNH